MKLSIHSSKQATSVWLNKDYYWCLQYVDMVTEIGLSDLMSKALRSTLLEINKTGVLPKRPDPRHISRNGHRTSFYIPKDLKMAIGIIKINHDLSSWGMSDFIRIGLIRMFKQYQIRYPEMESVIRRFKDENKEDYS